MSSDFPTVAEVLRLHELLASGEPVGCRDPQTGKPTKNDGFARASSAPVSGTGMPLDDQGRAEVSR